jgi:hypothetical protein
MNIAILCNGLSIALSLVHNPVKVEDLHKWIKTNLQISSNPYLIKLVLCAAQISMGTLRGGFFQESS